MRFRNLFAGALLAVVLLAGCVPPTGPGPGPLPRNCVSIDDVVRCTFSYDGKDGSDGTAQTFVVPRGVDAVTIEAWGAQGGDAPLSPPQFVGTGGGLGGHVRGTLHLTAGTALSIRTGGQPPSFAGGFNGGGAGYAGGGGASDVRIGGDDLAARVVVAAGGGGEGVLGNLSPSLSYDDIPGGGGGGATGLSPCQVVTQNGTFTLQSCGGAGTPTSGGTAAMSSVNCPGTTSSADPSPGARGQGGDGGTVTCVIPRISFDTSVTGGGGGGGWFGGGGGAAGFETSPTVAGLSAAGGGGSSFVTPDATNPLNEAAAQPGNGYVTISYPNP